EPVGRRRLRDRTRRARPARRGSLVLRGDRPPAQPRVRPARTPRAAACVLRLAAEAARVMGCDIHLYVEQLVEGAWRCVTPPERDLERWPILDDNDDWWGPAKCMIDSPCFTCGGKAPTVPPCAACLGSKREPSWYADR